MRTNFGDLNIKLVGKKAVIDRRASQARDDAANRRPALPQSPNMARPLYDSKLEADYSRYLQCRVLCQEIRSFAYHVLTVHLPGGKKYTPDFAVTLADGTVEFHEVKGHHPNKRDSLTRLHVAAGMSPWWTFKLVTRQRESWIEKVITPC